MFRFAVAVICAVVLADTLRGTSAGMSMDQVKQTMKMVRNVCQPKTGVSVEMVEGVQAGNFPEDNNLKCYMKCVLGMMQSLKNGKYKPDAAMAQAKILLSGDTRDRVIGAMEKCRNAADGITEGCEVAFVTTKCIYNADPDCFFFP
ncbi:general odorant-binding protein 72-like [Zootermopsis nevadensis]|uniref:General odorant-binding protein 19a n=1 Tax=Zootermopsis nevadensis TaxID=136037 RepID=A0A067R658_ZOONE|nr:general odorant-binding protein 72-like [Zootermopsis nevadensis]KDR13658.1 General odorant-binding protein 19a [Zootermopsis nevadensis]